MGIVQYTSITYPDILSANVWKNVLLISLTIKIYINYEKIEKSKNRYLFIRNTHITIIIYIPMRVIWKVSSLTKNNTFFK